MLCDPVRYRLLSRSVHRHADNTNRLEQAVTFTSQYPARVARVQAGDLACPVEYGWGDRALNETWSSTTIHVTRAGHVPEDGLPSIPWQTLRITHPTSPVVPRLTLVDSPPPPSDICSPHDCRRRYRNPVSVP